MIHQIRDNSVLVPNLLMAETEPFDVNIAIQRAKGSAHYRSLELPQQRAVWLHLEHGIAQRRAAEEEGISRSALQRGLTAEAENRKVGQNGRPGLLSLELETELKRSILQRSSSLNSMSVDEIRARVWGFRSDIYRLEQV